MPLSLRFAVRELRSGVRGFRIFLACLALGVAAIAAAGSTAEAFRHGLAAQAREILGGDVAVTVEQRRFTPAEQMALTKAGRVAWAGQAPMVVPGAVRDNIALARRHATADQVTAAAQAAGLTGDLERMLDERGGGLSGGELRRLGLARAFLKDSSILLLDEPTANLDREAEAAMIETIRRAAQGRTTLIATHSAAVAAVADRVVRL